MTKVSNALTLSILLAVPYAAMAAGPAADTPRAKSEAQTTTGSAAPRTTTTGTTPTGKAATGTATTEGTTAATQVAMPPAGAATQADPLQRLMSAADDLRRSIQTLSQQKPGKTRDTAMASTREALKQTQSAMSQLPPELRLDATPASTGSASGTKRRSSELLDSNLVGANGEDVADVQDLVIGPDWKVQGAVIEWGGFMGLGERRAVVPVDRITFDGGSNGRGHLDMTREQLEKLPEATLSDDS